MIYKFISNDASTTANIGKLIASIANKGDVILLYGDLGAGKTTMTKGLALGLGISERVNSPTFNIMKLYLSGKFPMAHIDAYRLEDSNKDIGLEEFIGVNTLCVIEWPDYISEYLPSEFLKITLTHAGENSRNIEIVSNSSQYDKFVKAVSEAF